jgi:hypothetical protein
VTCLTPLLGWMIEEGIAADEFAPHDPRCAARYAIAFDALHDLVATTEGVRMASEGLDVFVLWGLDWTGQGSR